jgi:hypothetical protein
MTPIPAMRISLEAIALNLPAAISLREVTIVGRIEDASEIGFYSAKIVMQRMDVKVFLRKFQRSFEMS